MGRKQTEKELPGGVRVGDRVRSKVDRTGEYGVSVCEGDLGTVLGHDDRAAADSHRRVQVEFPNFPKCAILPTEFGKEKELPGGVYIGDRVRSTLNCAADGGESVCKGDVGTVLGPCPPTVAGSSLKVLVEFPDGKQHAILPEGFEKELPGRVYVGDRVRSKIICTGEYGVSVCKGDLGTVLGRDDRAAADSHRRVLVEFPNFPKCAILSTEFKKEKELPGGVYVGDRVRSKIDCTGASGKFVCKGNLGTVLGPYRRDQVEVEFPKWSKRCFMSSTHFEKELPGGVYVGDRVRSMLDSAADDGESVCKGDVGTVLGPCPPTIASSLLKVLVEFPKWKQRAILPESFEKELPGGVYVGDRVRSKMDHTRASGGSVCKGDLGMVLGPHDADSHRRVMVEFPNWSRCDISANNFERELVELVDFAEGDGLLIRHAVINAPEMSFRESVEKFEGISFLHGPSQKAGTVKKEMVFRFADFEREVQECEEWVDNMAGKLKKEMQPVGRESLATIRAWTRNMCYVVNSRLRDPKRTEATLAPVAPFLRNLLVGLRRLPRQRLYQGELFRIERGVRSTWDQKVAPDKVVDFFNPLSFSTDTAVLDRFVTADEGDRTLIKLTEGTGYKISDLSYYPDEAEVLVICIVRIRVTKCEKYDACHEMVRTGQVKVGLHWLEGKQEPGLELLPGSPAMRLGGS